MISANIILLLFCIVPIILVIIMAIPAARFTKGNKEDSNASSLHRKIDYRYLVRTSIFLIVIVLILCFVGYFFIPTAIFYLLEKLGYSVGPIT